MSDSTGLPYFECVRPCKGVLVGDVMSSLAFALMVQLIYCGRERTMSAVQCDRPWLIYDLQVCRLVSLAG